MNNPIFDRIRQDLADNDVVLYMKGTPMFPQCGFSAAVVQVLADLGVPFKGIDVLVDSSLRVRGVARLRVIDASIMPLMPAANTNAPSIMIGEKGAAMVLANA